MIRMNGAETQRATAMNIMQTNSQVSIVMNMPIGISIAALSRSIMTFSLPRHFERIRNRLSIAGMYLWLCEDYALCSNGYVSAWIEML